MENIQIKQIVEALIFAANKPLPLNQIDEVLEKIGTKSIKARIEELNAEYAQEKKPYRIKEIAGGFVMATTEEFAPWLKKLYDTQTKEKLSAPALETLAIVAYKQPVTKPTIEAIRGVNADGVLRKLLEKGLIKISGRKDAPGRPFIYSTTREFLQHFGLAKLEELPLMEDFGIDDVKLEKNEMLVETEVEELEKVGSLEESERET